MNKPTTENAITQQITALAIIAFLGAALASCSGIRQSEPQTRGVPNPAYRIVNLYFLNDDREMEPGVSVGAPVRWIRVGDRFHKRAVKALLGGATEAEAAMGVLRELRATQFGSSAVAD
ncbi:MAG: hypothetical protein ACI8UO_005209 [Verrucomicrobiales bacterium]|jgi:hypothetical protein